MATNNSNNTTTVNVNVESNLKDQVDLSEKLKNNLKAAASGRITLAQAAAAKGVNAGGQASEDSNVARGISGQTGAAGRDFAAQARGLGGLVHVYATFAANLFAISAAFTALNKAANIENMMKGLDQLGASAGRNLGNLAKQVTYAADGALSLADAMTAVAQASAAGMTNVNIVRMTEVAKKASQALGRDMADAVSRLSRGITKIEPELLDELGILVKVDEANRNYALSLGRTVTSLSDFEKRQAYANAVLAEGEKKFSKIELAANPYQKLLASITNLAVSAGTALNSVLGPVVTLLSTSPTALAAALGAVATVLIKQAIPALGQFRKNAQEAAVAANTALISRFKDLENLATKADEDAFERFNKNFRLQEENTKKLLGLKKGVALQDTTSTKFASIKDITKKDPLALTDEDLKLVNARIKSLKDSRSSAYQQDLANLKNWRDGVVSIQNKLKDERDKFWDEREKREEQDSKITSHYGQLQRISDAAAKTASDARIKALVAETAATYGVRQAAKTLREELEARRKSGDTIQIVDPKTQKSINVAVPQVKGFFGAVRDGALIASSAVTVATSKINTLLSAFAPWITVIGLAVSGIGLLFSVMSNNNKEMDSFSESIDSLNSSFSNVDRTLESISLKDPLDRLSIESITAKSSALDDLSTNLNILVTRFDKVISAGNGWDKVADKFWDMFGKGNADKLSKNMSETISSAMKLLDPTARANFAKEVNKILGTNINDFNNVDKINESIKDLDDAIIRSKVGELNSKLKEVNESAKLAANTLNSFKSQITELSKEVDKYTVSLKPTDSFSKIGEGLISSSTTLAKALEAPKDGLLALLKVAESINTLSLLPENSAKDLIEGQEQLKKLNAELAKEEEQVLKLQNDYAKAKDMYLNAVTAGKKDNISGGDSYKYSVIENNAKKIMDTLEPQIEASVSVLDNTKASISSVLNDYRKISTEMFAKGGEILTIKLNNALSQGAITIANAYLNTLKSLGSNTADLEAQLQKEELAIQKSAIEIQYKLLEVQTKNNLLIDRNNTLIEKDILMSDKRRGIFDSKLESRLQQLNTSLEGTEKALASFDSKGGAAGRYRELAAKNSKGTLPAENIAEMNSLQGLGLATIERDTQLAAVNAKAAAIEYNRLLGIVKEFFNYTQETLDVDIRNIDVKKQYIDILTKVSEKTYPLLEAEKLTMEAQRANLVASKEMNDLYQKQSAMLMTINSLKMSGRDTTSAEIRLKEMEKETSQKSALFDAEDFNRRITNIAKLADLQVRADKEKQEDATKYKEYSDAIQLSNISLNDQQLQGLKTLNAIYEEQFVIRSSANEQAKVAIEYSKQLNALENERVNTSTKYSVILAGLEEARAKTKDQQTYEQLSEIIRTISAEQARALALIDASKASSYSVYKNKLAELDVQKAINLELAEQDRITKDIAKATVSLALLFGKIGAGIGAVAEVLNKMIVREKAYGKQKLDIEKNLTKYREDPNNDVKDNIIARTEAEKELAKVQQDSAIEQMNSISAIAAATKEAFAEKTGAYKAFQAVEKAAAAYSLALQAQQYAKTLAELPEKVASGTAEIFKQLGAYGFPVAAAFLALMASLGAKSGSATAAVPIGNTSAEMQKIQGTGQKYDASGKLISNNGGVFGDQEAKSESIKNSLEIIRDNTIEGLGYDSKMLKALESIDQGINNTAKSLYNIPGLRSGSITGTADYSVSTSGIKNLFGSSTTKEIVDSGLEIAGTFSQLAENAKGLVRAYETIRSTKVSSGFFGIGGKTTVTDSKNYIGVSSQVEQDITSIFKNAKELFITVGDKIGVTADEVTKKLNSINIGNAFTSLRGLKGEELEKEFSAVIGSILDSASATIFSSMSKYAKFGEGLLETTVRVVDGFDKVKVALGSISVSVDKFTYDISEALINNAKGLDNFTSQVSFFSDNFLTEAERLAPITENVNKVLKSLGLSSVDTREEFAYVVKSLDLTTTAGRDTYQQLMDIAKAFADVHAETRVVLSVEERLAQLRAQYVRILELENKKAESVALSRQLELEAMDDALKLGAKYIWAMEDELALKNQITEAHTNEAQAIQTTIDSINESIDTLNKYKDSLKLGGQSVLTPAERYSEAKAQALKVAEIASSIANTEAEKKAKAEAISSLPAAAGAFLDASRTMFASSAQYTADYNTVLDLVSSTSSALEVQKSVAEQQLDALNYSYDSLNIIQEHTATMAELMPKFIEAQQATTAAMNAYYNAGGPNQGGSGITGLGVDVNTANSVIKLQNDALIKEVQLLNKQIDALRKEQNKQTADLVLAQKAVADAKAAADKAAADAAAAAQWNTYSAPWYDSNGAWVSTGG